MQKKMKTVLSSQLSEMQFSAGSFTISIKRGGSEETIYSNSHDSPIPCIIAGIDRIIEADLRKLNQTNGMYRIDIEGNEDSGTREYDVIYCDLPYANLERWSANRFLLAQEHLVFPGDWQEDIKIPIYTAPDSGNPLSVHIVQHWSEDGKMKMAEMDYPLSKGYDEIVIHASNFTQRPYSIFLTSGKRSLSIFLPKESPSANVFRYRDSFNRESHLILSGVTSESPVVENELAYVNGKLMKIPGEETTTYTLECEGLFPESVRQARDLLRSHDVTLNGEEIVVTEVTGDIDNDPTKLKTLKITYRPCY